MPIRPQQRPTHMAWMTLSLLIVFLVALVGCSGGGSTAIAPADPPVPPPVVADDVRYAGPGSHWAVDLGSDGSFEIALHDSLNSDVVFNVAGSFEKTAAGFVNLTVSQASGDGAPQSGDTAWGLEAPGLAFFLQPDNLHQADADTFISMVTAGQCPNQHMTSVWNTVRARSDLDVSETDADLFGGFSFDPATGAAEVSHRFALDSDLSNLGSSAIGTGRCANGIMSVTDANLYLADNGGAIVHVEPGTEDGTIIFALPAEPIEAVADIDGVYAGIAFSGSEELTDAPVRAFSAQCAAGSCQAELIEVGSGEATGERFGFDLTGTLNVPLPGQLMGSFVDGSDASPIACNVLVREATVLSCVGSAPGDPRSLLNLLLVEQS